jgi:hypothetical protein
MRTTLTLDDDAAELARTHARQRRLSFGAAVSELVRKGAEQPLVTSEVNGLRVVRLPDRSPTITVDQVNKLLEELP